MALGATARDVRWLIARDAAQVGVLGALAGCALIIALRPAVTRFVAAIELTIPIILASVATLMAVILLAAWFPAHRAAGTRPTDALRM
jgi:ABC-type antimicrobial peptide transport system permease subunit